MRHLAVPVSLWPHEFEGVTSYSYMYDKRDVGDSIGIDNVSSNQATDKVFFAEFAIYCKFV